MIDAITRFVDRITVDEAQRWFDEGQFPAGSMGPKMQAAIQFVRATGREVVITDVDHVRDALGGTGGTVVAS